MRMIKMEEELTEISSAGNPFLLGYIIWFLRCLCGMWMETIFSCSGTFRRKVTPGGWKRRQGEATAGGSALKGETPLEAAKRELQEETGLTGISFQEIGKQRTENTIFISYLVITDCDKTSVKLQEGETIGYQWLKEEEFLRFLDSSEVIPSQKERLIEYLNV